MKTNIYTLAIAAALTLGCNTFADPSFVDDVEDMGSTMDTGKSTDDAGVDVGVDANGDDADTDASEPTPTDWIPANGAPPRVPQSEFEGTELETCSDPLALIPSLRGNEVDILPIQGAEPRFATVAINNSDELVIHSARPPGDSFPTAEVVEVYRSDFKLAGNTESDVISAASVGNQFAVAAIDESLKVHLVQCVFAEREECRSFPLEYEASTLELLTIGDAYLLFSMEIGPSSFTLRDISVDQQTVSGGEPVTPYPAGSGILQIDSGIAANGRTIVVTGHQDGAIRDYRFGQFWGGEWSDLQVAVEQGVEPDVRMRAALKHFRDTAWFVTDDDGGLDMTIMSLTTDATSVGSEAGIGVVDFDLTPIAGGYIELFVNSLGHAKIVIDDDPVDQSVHSDPSVALENENTPLVLERPARVAAVGTQIGIVHRRQSGLYFTPICIAN